MARFTFENDEDGIAGEQCEQWIIRNKETDNRNIVAIVPKTGDEEYDSDITYRNVKLMAAAPDLLAALQMILDKTPVTHLSGKCYSAATKAVARATNPDYVQNSIGQTRDRLMDPLLEIAAEIEAAEAYAKEEPDFPLVPIIL